MDEFEKLILSLKNGKVQIRRDAAYLLGEKGDSRAIPALSHALQDNDKFVRARARDSLRQLNVPVADEVISTKWNRLIAAMEIKKILNPSSKKISLWVLGLLIIIPILISLILFFSIESQRKGGWEFYTKENSGLCNNGADEVVVDKSGRLWIASSDCLSI